MADFRVAEVHAFLMVGEDGDEGTPAFVAPDGTAYPLIAADPARLEALRPVAQAIADSTGRQVMLARFSVREDCEVILPGQPTHVL